MRRAAARLTCWRGPARRATAVPSLRGAAVRVFLCALGAAVCAVPAHAQAFVPDEPVFTSYGMQDGLSHGTINALLQDAAGFLWVATNTGLNRFDGSRFDAFVHVAQDERSLGDNFIRSLALAGDGRLWVGMERMGLNRFDPLTGTAERFPLFELGPWLTDALGPDERREGRTVSAIATLPDGTLLLATDLGVVHFDPATEAATPIDAGSRWELATQNALCALPAGRVLAGFTDGTITVVAPARERARPVVRLPAAISTLRCVGAGGVFAGTGDGEVYEIDAEAGASPRRVARLEPDAIGPLAVVDVMPGARGELWIATERGLYRARPGVATPRRVGQSGPRALPAPEITALVTDATGMVWIGTWNGLAGLHPLAASIARVPTSDDGQGLLGGGVIAIEPIADDAFVLGTYANGVHVLRTDGADGTWSLRREDALAPSDSATVFDLARAPDGTLWIAAFQKGLLRLDPGGRSARAVPVVTRAGDAVEAIAYSVFVDHRGDVWAGTRPHGLLRFDAGRDRFVEYRGPDGDWDFGSRWVWPIAEDTDGILWIGAFNGGLSAIEVDRQSLRHHRAGAGGMSDDRILTVFPDPSGFVWIGTQGGGMSRFEPATGRFRNYTTADGLPHANVEAFARDPAGYLWISTNDGIARLDPKTDEFRVLRARAGLAGDRFFANSVHTRADGRIFFGGPGGVSVIDAAGIAIPAHRTPVALTRFRINGEDAAVARALAAGGLELEPDQNFFTFEFAALDFRDPSLTRYRYRLEGLDPEWVEAGPASIANYTSVPPRRYRFRVQARNSDGVWNESAFLIPIRVQPHFYVTWWFRSLIAAIVVALISGFWAYRIRELHKRQNLRLGIAGKLHDDIGANLSAIALKADMVRRAETLDDRRRLQLGDVGQLARDAALKVRETVWVVNTQYDTVAGLVSKLRDTAGTILDGQVRHHFSAPEPLPERDIRMELRQDIYLLYKEALHNVLKHAGALNVWIEIGFEARDLLLTVRDDGSGFDAGGRHDGSGMALMRRRAERHAGRLSIEARDGAGTTLSLRVPVK